MDKHRVKIDSLIVKQAIRDVASKDEEKAIQALNYFKSKDFVTLCDRNDIDSNKVQESVISMVDHPIISRKKISNKIANLIDESFVVGVLSR